jgi:hypothetical protein
MGSRTFRAKYDGECDDCGFAFDEGDTIGYDDSGNLSHARCLDEAASRESKSNDDDPF